MAACGARAAGGDAGGRFLRSTPAIGFSYIVDAFRQGLTDEEFVEGKNVTIEYRWADNQLDQLPELVADLVRKQVAALVGSGPAAAQASKAASNTTSVVFVVGSDPVRTGLVASLNRPGSNITGVVFTSVALAAKLLGMLHQLVPSFHYRRVEGSRIFGRVARLGGSRAGHWTKSSDGECRQRARIPRCFHDSSASGRQRIADWQQPVLSQPTPTTRGISGPARLTSDI